MTELLATFTALPNLHPAVVHLPIALAVVALGFQAAALLARRPWLDRAAATLVTLAALGAWAAWLAGRAAAEAVGQIPAAAEAVLADHADLALLASGALTVAAVLWLAATWRERRQERPGRGALRVLGAAAMVLAAALVGWTADLGGALVYRHGVAVAARPAPRPAPSPTPQVPAADPAARLERLEDGTLRWRPAPGDIAALGSVVRVLGPEGTVRAVPGEGPGLTVAVQGSGALCLPGETGDGVVEAVVTPLTFRGRIGIGLGIAGPDRAVVFELGEDGTARLLRRSGSDETVWDSAAAPAAGGRLRLGLSVAGRHLKGFLGGAMVTHGHGDPGPPGCAGLLLDGSGSVRIEAISMSGSGPGH